jgi:hypothetical protein
MCASAKCDKFVLQSSRDSKNDLFNLNFFLLILFVCATAHNSSDHSFFREEELCKQNFGGSLTLVDFNNFEILKSF